MDVRSSTLNMKFRILAKGQSADWPHVMVSSAQEDYHDRMRPAGPLPSAGQTDPDLTYGQNPHAVTNAR